MSLHISKKEEEYERLKLLMTQLGEIISDLESAIESSNQRALEGLRREQKLGRFSNALQKILKILRNTLTIF